MKKETRKLWVRIGALALTVFMLFGSIATIIAYLVH